MMMPFYDTIKALLEECIQHEIASKLLHHWVPVTLWYQACATILPQSPLQSLFGEKGGLLLERDFNTCLSRHYCFKDILHFLDPIMNTTGIFKIMVSRKVLLYVTDDKGNVTPSHPRIDPPFRAQVEETTKKFLRSLRQYGRGPLDVMDNNNLSQSRNVRPKLHPQEEDKRTESAGPSEEVPVENKRAAMPPGLFSYWESSEARKLFGSRPDDSDAHVTLLRRIQLLQNVNAHVHGYKLVIEGGDPKNECTESDIHNLQQRALILILVYKRCLLQMGTGMESSSSFSSCIEHVLEILKDTGMKQATRGYYTVQKWNISFRQQELWPHPRRMVGPGSTRRPGGVDGTDRGEIERSEPALPRQSFNSGQ
jgi:hypothetical protein